LGNAFVWLILAYVTSFIGFLVVNIASARLLGIENYGSFLVVTTVALVVGQLALFGAHRAGLRDMARIENADRGSLGGILEEGAAVACLAVPAVAIGSAVVYLGASAGGMESTRTELLLALELAVLICLTALQKLGANYLRGLGRLGVASFVDGSSGGALTMGAQSLSLGGILLCGLHTSLPVVLAVVAFGYLPSMILIATLLRGLWPSTGLRRKLHVLRLTIHRYRVFAIIQVIAFAGASLEIWLAVLTLSADQASLFGAAQRLALMVAVPLTALQSVVSPAIARSTMTPSPSHLQGALRTSATLALGGAFMIALPMVIWPAQAIGVFFGSDPSGFNAVLIVLVLGQLINVATGMCATVLTMTHFEGTVGRVTSANLGLRVLLGLPAAMLLGPMGLAVTSTALTAAMWAYLVVQARTKCNLDTLPSWRPTLASLRLVRG
jgi:O-antigen/teichoic acid export membrane protein